MEIHSNFSLKKYNTFGIDVSCKYFAEITSVEALQALFSNRCWKDTPKLILGEGSNVLFTQDFPGLVVKVAIRGITKTAENDQHVWVNAAAGEAWHQLVLYCIEHQLAGIENLSLIPGTVGAAPLQNIGAYGVELCEVFEKLTAIRMDNGEICEFDAAACQFGYRDSVFKRELKNQYLILSVDLRLNKTPVLRTDYGAIKETLAKMQVNEVTIKTISDAVIKIRQQKLPDPQVICNAGSFFKSPFISNHDFSILQQKYPEVPYFKVENNYFKIPAGWLIEQCGWKGRRFGDVGVHVEHALVLVNYGKGTGLQIKNLAQDIQTSVKEKFAIELIPEVNLI